MMDKELLKHQFYDVMHKYKIPFTEKGVMENLEGWWYSKKTLYSLLSKHPNWDERSLALVFRFSEERELDHNIVDEAKFEMMELARECGLSGDALDNFDIALDCTTASYSRVPDLEMLPRIEQYGGITCAPGQKASRIINKLCLHFGLDKFTKEKVERDADGGVTVKTICPYNAVFARLADSLNPVRIPKTGVLSIHPCDFLEMSNKDDTWHSCHCLDDGGYRAGCYSYMGDAVSMIFFTVDENITSDYHKVPRITREIFCYHEGVLLQSRLYPSDDATQRDLYRDLVQRAVAECLRMPNLWTVKNKESDTQQYLITEDDTHHYPDYECGYAIVSLLKGWPQEYKPMTIGSLSLCPCCGDTIDYSHDASCHRCERKVVCKECGQEVPMASSHHVDGAFYCKTCRPTCAKCKSVISGAVHTAINHAGDPVHLCESCYEESVTPCRECGIHSLCGSLTAIRFCPWTELMATTARQVV